MLDARDDDAQGAARYDGLSAWYDQRLGKFSREAGEAIERLLGPGAGSCLDLCCGTGVHLETIARLGWRLTGIDISRDQLRMAAQRAPSGVVLVRGDAARLPYADGQFQAVVSMFSHTDVDDFAAVVREAARVLEAGGPFVYAGIHPCFVGPHTRLVADQAVPDMFAGYRSAGRHMAGPGVSPDGLWAKVGGVHLTLSDLLNAFLDAGLAVERFEERGDEDYPRQVVLRARRAV
jgi:ubiquinone/menaquinone biosynthesis C-methylase UbiE